MLQHWHDRMSGDGERPVRQRTNRVTAIRPQRPSIETVHTEPSEPNFMPSVTGVPADSPYY